MCFYNGKTSSVLYTALSTTALKFKLCWNNVKSNLLDLPNKNQTVSFDFVVISVLHFQINPIGQGSCDCEEKAKQFNSSVFFLN